MKKVVFSALALGLVFASCGGGSDQKQGDKKDSKPEVQLRQGNEDAEEIDVPDEVELTIEGNDQMKYNKDRMEVYEGQEVTLTLKHVGEMTLEQMGHNVVILAKGVEVSDFAADAVDAGLDNSHIPQDRADDIIVHTDMIGGGEETSVTFTAPEAGTYDFICSFPGHSGMMKGKFVVKANPGA